MRFYYNVVFVQEERSNDIQLKLSDLKKIYGKHTVAIV